MCPAVCVRMACVYTSVTACMHACMCARACVRACVCKRVYEFVCLPVLELHACSVHTRCSVCMLDAFFVPAPAARVTDLCLHL
jgi:hypothetical protein